ASEPDTISRNLSVLLRRDRNQLLLLRVAKRLQVKVRKTERLVRLRDQSGFLLFTHLSTSWAIHERRDHVGRFLAEIERALHLLFLLFVALGSLLRQDR